jgi:hypothetical protein
MKRGTRQTTTLRQPPRWRERRLKLCPFILPDSRRMRSGPFRSQSTSRPFNYVTGNWEYSQIVPVVPYTNVLTRTETDGYLLTEYLTPCPFVALLYICTLKIPFCICPLFVSAFPVSMSSYSLYLPSLL